MHTKCQVQSATPATRVKHQVWINRVNFVCCRLSNPMRRAAPTPLPPPCCVPSARVQNPVNRALSQPEAQSRGGPPGAPALTGSHLPINYQSPFALLLGPAQQQHPPTSRPHRGQRCCAPSATVRSTLTRTLHLPSGQQQGQAPGGHRRESPGRLLARAQKGGRAWKGGTRPVTGPPPGYGSKSVHDANVFSIVRLCGAVMPHMAKRKTAVIVNMESVVGELWQKFVGWSDTYLDANSMSSSDSAKLLVFRQIKSAHKKVRQIKIRE
ncbi:hypothetical protein C8J57DRAFT_1228360 [Mycena rebaudengoi]|nr:hypothetical protein C8J57DRAFT_1228360 [Mycena rebaudengoi]